MLLPTHYSASIFLDDGSFLKRQSPHHELMLDELNVSAKELKHQRPSEMGMMRHGTSMGAKFRNFRRHKLTIFWDDGTAQGTYSGVIPALGRTATNTYQGHAFIFRDEGGAQIARFEMVGAANLYIIEPEDWDEETRDSKLYKDAKAEEQFMLDYKRRTGTPWLSYYPRKPPILNIWPAETIGQTHVVASPYGHLYTDRDAGDHDIALRLVVLSHAPAGPRVFLIPELLSAFECAHVVQLGEKVVRQSMVGQNGGFQSKTRTSQNGWLSRSKSSVLEHVYKRFGHVLGIDDTLLGPRFNAEELQVVKYDRFQEYAPHHDFGDDGTPEQRFLTLLLYIQVPDQGGATSFPKAFDGRGFQVVPNTGDAVLFYNMLPDGNADDLALHAGMPVKVGTKWVRHPWCRLCVNSVNGRCVTSGFGIPTGKTARK